MSWLGWLALVVIVTASAALAGLQTKGTRPVAHTGLMSAARLVLAFGLLVLAYLFYRARLGG